ncbi:MAG: NAD(+)/NADH kinase [Firmicutes bacterium]|nr:NAD(+)/NADH kinase [Bacillota bacterium]
MNIAIYTNTQKDKGDAVTKMAKKKFTSSGFSVDTFFDKKDFIGSQKHFDVVVVVGGDGTILRIVEHCAEKDIAIVGINLGKLGFLADIEKEDIDKLISCLKNSCYTKTPQPLLKTEYEGKKFYALNETYIKSCDEGMMEVEVSVVGRYRDTFYSDGYMVATTFGSTAYALSCGGPLIERNVPAHILVPINAHTLSARPLVISNSDTVVMSIRNSCCTNLYVDGQNKASIEKNSPVKITASKKIATFIRLDGGHSPFSKIEKKRG